MATLPKISLTPKGITAFLDLHIEGATITLLPKLAKSWGLTRLGSKSPENKKRKEQNGAVSSEQEALKPLLDILQRSDRWMSGSHDIKSQKGTLVSRISNFNLKAKKKIELNYPDESLYPYERLQNPELFKRLKLESQTVEGNRLYDFNLQSIDELSFDMEMKEDNLLDLKSINLKVDFSEEEDASKDSNNDNHNIESNTNSFRIDFTTHHHYQN